MNHVLRQRNAGQLKNNYSGLPSTGFQDVTAKVSSASHVVPDSGVCRL